MFILRKYIFRFRRLFYYRKRNKKQMDKDNKIMRPENDKIVVEFLESMIINKSMINNRNPRSLGGHTVVVVVGTVVVDCF